MPVTDGLSYMLIRLKPQALLVPTIANVKFSAHVATA